LTAGVESALLLLFCLQLLLQPWLQSAPAQQRAGCLLGLKQLLPWLS
jgi:hypothetical protein